VRLFQYEVKTPEGQTLRGQIQGQNEEAAAAQLHAQGYWVARLTPLATAEVAAPRRSLLHLFFPPVRLKDIAAAFRELATMVNSGMTLIRSVDVLERNTTNPHLRQALRSVQAEIEHGGALSEAMRKHPSVFSDLAVGMIAAGEQSGKLDELLTTLAEYVEDELEIQHMIRRETFYAKILFAAICLIPLAAVFFIASLGMSSMSSFTLAATLVAVGGLGALGLLVAGVVLVRAYSQSRTGKRWIDNLKLRLPILGKITQRFTLARFSRALSALYSAGIPIIHALPIAGRASGNEVVADAGVAASQELQQGRDSKVHAALARTRLFPDMVVQMINTGEETGNLDGMLDKVAEYYKAEAITATKQIGQAIIPLVVLIGAVVVAILLITFYTGLYSGVSALAR